MPKLFTYIFRNVWRHALFVFLVSILTAGFFSEGRIFYSWQSFLFGTLWSTIIWLSQWFGNGWISMKLDRLIPWLERPALRLLVGIPAIAAYSSVAIVLVSAVFEYWLGGGIPDFWKWALATSKIAVVIALTISGIFAAIGFFMSWRDKSLEAERLQKELISYKYEVLRNQLNPHFLFNSFNVLSDLVYEDQKLAVKFIKQMSEVYRYVLDSRELEFVTIKAELEFVRSFIFLLEIRFGDNLQVEIDVDDTSGCVVPMVLQLLVENAVKHNEISSDRPLSIRLKREGDRLVVSNKLQRKSGVQISSGFGLENIKQRYSQFEGRGVEISPADSTFVVSIPIIDEQ